MLSTTDYYKAPSQEIFEDIKAAAIALWETYDNTYGYVDKKVSRIANLKNVSDNYAFIVAMFDQSNQAKLALMVKRNDTKQLLFKLTS